MLEDTILLVEDFVINVRPEFLEDESRAIQTHARHPALTHLGPVAVSGRVVEAGDARSRTGADHFGEVEVLPSIVLTRDDDPREGVRHALHKTAAPLGVV